MGRRERGQKNAPLITGDKKTRGAEWDQKRKIDNSSVESLTWLVAWFLPQVDKIGGARDFPIQEKRG